MSLALEVIDRTKGKISSALTVIKNTRDRKREPEVEYNRCLIYLDSNIRYLAKVNMMDEHRQEIYKRNKGELLILSYQLKAAKKLLNNQCFNKGKRAALEEMLSALTEQIKNLYSDEIYRISEDCQQLKENIINCKNKSNLQNYRYITQAMGLERSVKEIIKVGGLREVEIKNYRDDINKLYELLNTIIRAGF